MIPGFEGTRQLSSKTLRRALGALLAGAVALAAAAQEDPSAAGAPAAANEPDESSAFAEFVRGLRAEAEQRGISAARHRFVGEYGTGGPNVKLHTASGDVTVAMY
jgi:membrane-bound lytic murein transglycosylase B